MIRRTLAAAVALMCAGVAVGQNAAGPAPLPTMDEIKAEFNAGKWMDCLKLIAKIEQQLGRAGNTFDVYEVQTLNAECHIQLKNGDNAIRLLTAAEKAGKTKSDVAKAFATRVLIQKKNAAWQYAPAVNKDGNTKNDVEPLDIVDRAKRIDAIKALYADSMALVKANERNVLAGKALPPIADFAGSLVDIRKLEYAATDGEKECDGMIANLKRHAQQTIETAINDLSRNVDEINRRANENVEYTQNVPDPANPGRTIQRRIQARRGLQGNDSQVLNNAIGTASQLPAMTRTLEAALGDKGAFDASVNKSNAMGNKANQTLRTDYTRR